MIEPLKILDTFAGIGGFSYAAHELVGGFETTQFVEIDPFCQKVLKKHFPNVPCHDDIKTFTAYPGQYDVITGGFPCQDISVAGGREGITEKSRSGLFYELMRVIRLVRPKFVIMDRCKWKMFFKNLLAKWINFNKLCGSVSSYQFSSSVRKTTDTRKGI